MTIEKLLHDNFTGTPVDDYRFAISKMMKQYAEYYARRAIDSSGIKIHSTDPIVERFIKAHANKIQMSIEPTLPEHI